VKTRLNPFFYVEKQLFPLRSNCVCQFDKLQTELNDNKQIKRNIVAILAMRMRYLFFITTMMLYIPAWGQIEMPSYKIRQDSLTHITVTHIDNKELLRIRTSLDSSIVQMIKPEIIMKSGVVDHRGLTGDMYARLYYSDSLLIGYIEYDGKQMKRELYFNADGNIFLEKRYMPGGEVVTNNKIQPRLTKIKR